MICIFTPFVCCLTKCHFVTPMMTAELIDSTRVMTVAGSCINSASSCLTLYNSSPNISSGTYSLDIDGNGPIPAFNAYCDMTGSGGWTLVAVRIPLIQLFTETVYTPLTTAHVSGRLQGGNIWSLSSTFSFQQLRYSNSAGYWATANFGSPTSLSALNAQYSSYSCTPTTASVTSTLSILTHWYFRGVSGSCALYDDNCDWAALAFSAAMCTASDVWDVNAPWWIMSGESCI